MVSKTATRGVCATARAVRWIAAGLSIALLAAATPAQAANLAWDAGSTTDLNWSNSANWNPDGPPGGNAIMFDDTGGAASGTTSIVNQPFTISSLGFTNSSTAQGLDITNPATTLTVNSSGGVTFGSSTINNNVSTYFTGSGTLAVNNSSANFNVGVDNAAATSYTQTVDMSGLSNFTFSGNKFNVGVGINSSSERSNGGNLKLASSSSITANTLTVGNDGPCLNTGPTSYLQLSTGTNVINATTINVARSKSNGRILFTSTAATTPTVTIRGKAGGTSRVGTFTIGNHSVTTGSATTGIVDFSLGKVDARITTLNIGVYNYSRGSAFGTFIMGPDPDSVVDVTTVNIAANSSKATGTLDIRGGTFKFGAIPAAKGTANIHFTGGTIASNTTSSTMTPAFHLGLAGSTAAVAFGETSAPTRSLRFNGSVTLDGDTTLTVNVPTTFAGVVSGDGGAAYGLTKGGDGTLVLTASNTYPGLTTVNDGTLLINGSVAGDAVVNGGMLGGGGTIGGTVTVNAGGTLSPGGSIGTLTAAGDVTIGGTLLIEIDPAANPGEQVDMLDVSGLLDIQYATLDLDILGALSDSAYVFALYGQLAGNEFVGVLDLPPGYEIDYNYLGDHQIALVAVSAGAIPEPASALLLMLAVPAVAARLRRRLRVPS